MLNENLFLLSFDELKNVLLHEATMFHLAVIYILMYVIYKAFGRYIYFKPQEHSSKINRTFLTISILIVLIMCLKEIEKYLPFLQQYKWFYVLCTLVVIIALLSLVVDRIIWSYDKRGYKRRRDWHYNYLPINNDWYKKAISKREDNGNGMSSQWEEEGVESTNENINSDVLLHAISLAVFTYINLKWAYESSINYNNLSYIYTVLICLVIGGLFIDRAIFSWIDYLETNGKKLISTCKKAVKNLFSKKNK